MKVSIIIPCYNSSNYFENLKSSISPYLNDSDYEIIFIDDCSLLSEKEILKKFINELDSKNILLVFNEVNLGVSISRRKCVELARGKYIAFLDSDDAWHKDKIRYQFEVMEDLDIDILGGYTNVINISQFDILNKKNINMNNDGLKKLNFNNFLFKNYYSTPSVMVKRSVILKENFSDQMRYSEDFECWRRISLNHISYFMTESYTYSFKHSYLSSSSSLSSNLLKMSLGELKGLFLSFKMKLNFYQYILLMVSIVISVLKSFKRLVHYKFN